MNFIFYSCRINFSLIKLVSPRYSTCEQNSDISSLGLTNMAIHFHVEKALLHLFPLTCALLHIWNNFYEVLPGHFKKPFSLWPSLGAAFKTRSRFPSHHSVPGYPLCGMMALIKRWLPNQLCFNQLTSAVSLPQICEQEGEDGFQLHHTKFK